ncbi:hypothetical protein ACFSQJ_15965 [Croceitalea marina]|uniref:Uncharacterized protein n=1 Tax=Croceitalea marina TaxID=1775166 RepID=A0ABW5MZY2_9FLAO
MTEQKRINQELKLTLKLYDEGVFSNDEYRKLLLELKKEHDKLTKKEFLNGNDNILDYLLG